MEALHKTAPSLSIALKRGQRSGFALVKWLAILGVIALVFALFLPVTRTAGRSARKVQCMSEIRNVALALQHYASANNDALPPAYTVDADGQPLHSWRTLILPALDNTELYKALDLSKPWDDPANAAVFARFPVPAVYQCPDIPRHSNLTTYLAVIDPHGCFRGSEPIPFSDATDDHARTLLLIEAPLDHAVPWMSPQDADVNMLLELRSNSSLAHSGGLNAVMLDGSARFLGTSMSALTWIGLISTAGNEDFRLPSD